jgi:phospholipid/cholesterol/gamma-HCH transport system substrate-binding protein
MKQTKTTELLVGMLIAAGFAALFVLAMKVSNLSSFSAADSYRITARFDNIGGLKVRSPVVAGGVLVGRISSIDYDSQRYEAVVVMEVDQAYDHFPDDTVASIYTFYWASSTWRWIREDLKDFSPTVPRSSSPPRRWYWKNW